MAGPRFLGTLRAALGKSVREVVTEVARDLVHQDERVLREYLPDRLFLQRSPHTSAFLPPLARRRMRGTHAG